MKRRPDVAVKLILRCGSKILMLNHRNGTFDFPGGRIEWLESPEEALRRELVEELKYTIIGNIRFFDIWNYISRDKQRQSIFLYYFQSIKKRPELRSTEHARILWLSKQELKPIIKNPAFLKKIFSLKPIK
ncbi:MAG: NUDIX hydrolase [Patescibacteria group bacterium]|nr:NUDIX hydrolase [Patescibacteria group bacterium]